MTKTAQYTGKPKTRKLGDNWLNPGDVVSEPESLVDALLKCNDFELVDTTAAKTKKTKKDKEV